MNSSASDARFGYWNDEWRMFPEETIMTSHLYRYHFRADLPVDEIEATLMLAILATEGRHGEAQVRLDLQHAFDPATRTYFSDAETAAGRDLNKLFVRLITGEFGAEAFTVDHLCKRPDAAVAVA